MSNDLSSWLNDRANFYSAVATGDIPAPTLDEANHVVAYSSFIERLRRGARRRTEFGERMGQALMNVLHEFDREAYIHITRTYWADPFYDSSRAEAFYTALYEYYKTHLVPM